MTLRRSAMLLWQSAFLISQVSALHPWAGSWYGKQYKPSSEVEFPNATLDLHENLSGAYENGDGLAFGLTFILNNWYSWYGSMQGNSNMHCTFEQDNTFVFCTWQSPVGDHYFTGSKTPNATSMLV